MGDVIAKRGASGNRKGLVVFLFLDRSIFSFVAGIAEIPNKPTKSAIILEWLLLPHLRNSRAKSETFIYAF